jgi:hypothetical protein
MRRLSLDDPISWPLAASFSPHSFESIRGCAALGENVPLPYPSVLCEPINADHERRITSSRSEPLVGFFALSLHNARRICFWVYDKSHFEWSGRADLNLSRFAGVSVAGARWRNPESAAADEGSRNQWSGRADLNCRPLAPQVETTREIAVFCPKTAAPQSSECRF